MATIHNVKAGTTTAGSAGSDVFEINAPTKFLGSLSIDGGTSGLDNAGAAATAGTTSGTIATALTYATDRTLNIAFRPGSTTSIDTNATSIAGYNAEDVLVFRQSGDYSELGAFFTNIETVQLASGVNIRLSSEVFEEIETYADRGAVSYGILFKGVAGGKAEKVTFAIEYDDDGIVTPAVGDAYAQADIQLDDYSFASVFRDVQVVYDGREDPSASGAANSFGHYLRIDGANESGGGGELVYGSGGVDNATMRLGNDSYYGFDGNDLLAGHGGADFLDGGNGNDVFLISGFGTGTSGTNGKSDDGKAEWIISAAEAARTGVTNGITNAADYAGKTDVIIGGAGFDTLRVNAGVGATNAQNGTIVLNDANFSGMEKVEVGGTISKDPDESTYLQLRDGHYHFARSSLVSDFTSPGAAVGNSINQVVINASGVTKNGLTFEGNANTQKFIGTTQSDVLIGNEGADTLTGGAGADKFVYQTVREYGRDSGSANGVIAYAATDEALDASDADVITDFATGTDKLVFRVESTTALEDTFDSLVALTKGNLTATNVLIGDLTGIDTAGTGTSFIKVDMSGDDARVYYDADGSGAGTAMLLATLTGVPSLAASDFALAAVQGF